MSTRSRAPASRTCCDGRLCRLDRGPTPLRNRCHDLHHRTRTRAVVLATPAAPELFPARRQAEIRLSCISFRTGWPEPSRRGSSHRPWSNDAGSGSLGLTTAPAPGTPPTSPSSSSKRPQHSERHKRHRPISANRLDRGRRSGDVVTLAEGATLAALLRVVRHRAFGAHRGGLGDPAYRS